MAGTGLFAGVVFLGLSGLSCANEQEPLIVLHTLAGEPSDPNEQGIVQCEYNSGGPVRTSGRFDVRTGVAYQMAPVVLNNLAARVNASNTGVNDSELQLMSEVDIRLNVPSEVRDAMGTDDAGNALPLTFTANIATDSIGPSDEFVAILDVIPADYAVAFQEGIAYGDEVDASVDIIFHATRTGNSRGNAGVLDSRRYSFPISLCNGCLVFSCTCDTNDECELGSETFWGHCGVGADVFGDGFSCSDPLPATGTGATTGDMDDGSTSLPPDPPPTTTATG